MRGIAVRPDPDLDLDLDGATRQCQSAPPGGRGAWRREQRHTLAPRAGGALFAWGDDADGQLGIGGGTSRSSPGPVP